MNVLQLGVSLFDSLNVKRIRLYEVSFTSHIISLIYIVYISCVNLFFNGLSYVFDLSYQFVSGTYSFLHCMLLHMRNTSELKIFAEKVLRNFWYRYHEKAKKISGLGKKLSYKIKTCIQL